MITLAKITDANSEIITIFFDADSSTVKTSAGDVLFEGREFNSALMAYSDVFSTYNDPQGHWGFVDLFEV